MDAVLGIFNNPLTLVVVGLVVKYIPQLKGIPNLIIPFLNAALALLSQVAAPQAAHAASGPLAVAAVFGGAFNFLGPIGSAVWQSVQASLIHEFFLRHPIAAAQGKG